MTRDPREGTWSAAAAFRALLGIVLGVSLGTITLPAQTQQPFVFATTQVNGNPAVATLQRNDATGTLTEVANSPFLLRTQGCGPTTIDVNGRFLFGACGDGVALYNLNASTGEVSEAPNSPFAASTGSSMTVFAEASGQYVYALKIAPTSYPTPSAVTLDSLTIDAANNVLNAGSSQTFTLPGTFLGIIPDPNHHFVEIYMQVSDGAAEPYGQGCGIYFDPQSGLPENATSGYCQGEIAGGANPIGIGIAGTGTLIGTAARGQNLSSFDVFAISPADGSLVASGNFSLSDPNDAPAVPIFDPTGHIAYVNTDSTGLRIFGISVEQNSLTISELPSSPLPSNLSSAFISGLPNPSADFFYVGGSNSILAYAIDTTTGYPGAAIQNNFNHSPALNYQPVLATLAPPGQPVSAPAVMIAPQSVNFGSINSGQMSGPQTVTISSTGNQALTISSLALSPAAGPFSEMDTCISHPVLAPGTSCTVSISYAPTVVGTTQSALVITDNAAGSPQSVALSGTAIAPPPPAPQITLMPGTLNFPGMTTQGISSAAQSINITNSGNASLTFASAPTLNGGNAADFSISSSTCTGTLAANAACSVTLVFSPLAAGVRTTNLVITDNAANSPQAVTINGTANPAATIVATAGGSTSASVTAGQPAQYDLQATPGAGFSGTLMFACSGLPAATNCTAPNLTVTNGIAANFTVTVTTSGKAAFLRPSSPRAPWPPIAFSVGAALSLLTLLLWMSLLLESAILEVRVGVWRRLAGLATLAFVVCGCGGGSGSSQPPGVATPAGTYTLTITPSATATGSSKNLQMSPISLSLTVQ